MLCWSLLVAGDQVARQLSGLLLRELVRGASDTFAAHASAALPSAFVACHDEDADVAAIWKDVWEEGTGSPAAAARLYLAEISAIICSGLCTCHKQHPPNTAIPKTIAAFSVLCSVRE